MKRIKLICVFMAVLMLLSLTACGKGKPEDSNLLMVGEFELLYKGASIMKDYEGNDALVLTLDFTNNSKDTTDYFWSIYETAIQNDTELEMAIVYLDADTMEAVDDSQYENVAPGETIEVQTGFVLSDSTSEVVVTFEEMDGSKNDSITIDLSTVSLESSQGGSASLTGGSKTEGSGGLSGVSADGNLLDWWNGDWYGWWTMSGCYGYYEGMDGQWWDVCGVIDIDEDYTGTVTLWDVDYSREDPMASVSVSLSEAGTSELGTMMSEGGWFTDVPTEHADWIVDPGLVDFENMIWIDGYYENGEDEYYYEIYLRPWGTYWNDLDEASLPYYYSDWYLPMIKTGLDMPDNIGVGLENN